MTKVPGGYQFISDLQTFSETTTQNLSETINRMRNDGIRSNRLLFIVLKFEKTAKQI